jgi:hypothetical protein
MSRKLKLKQFCSDQRGPPFGRKKFAANSPPFFTAVPPLCRTCAGFALIWHGNGWLLLCRHLF